MPKTLTDEQIANLIELAEALWETEESADDLNYGDGLDKLRDTADAGETLASKVLWLLKEETNA